MKLYDYELSGNCYKIRLFLSILGQAHDSEAVDFYPGKAHKSPTFLAINPLGQLPVLEDGGLVLRDAQAILTYLAVKYDPSRLWFPVDDPDRLGEVAQWMAFADLITASASAARLHDGLFYDLDVDRARAEAHRLFRILDEHLWFQEHSGLGWLGRGDHPSVADIACFPYVALSEEGGIGRQDYPTIRRWCDRVKRVKGFIEMPGIFASTHAA